MDQKGAFNPSRCEILSAEIVPFGKNVGDKNNPNISAMIAGFDISQSVMNTAITGNLEVYDGIGILENTPLRGEEMLILTIKAFDLQKEINLVCQIYKIDDININDNQLGLSYTIHWVTKTSYEASKKSIITSYNNKTASVIVKDLFKKHYHGGNNLLKVTTTPATGGPKYPQNTEAYNISRSIDPNGRKLYIETTTDALQLTIPDLSPAQAIQFVARRTYGQQPNAGSSFRFFENYNGYYFVSDEWLYEWARQNGNATFQYGAFISLDPEDAIEQITSLSTFGNPLRVDVGSEMNSGAYNTNIIEIDILNRNWKNHKYKYEDFLKKFKDSTGNQADIKNDKHTKDFIDSTFNEKNAKQYMIIRDYKDDAQSKGFKSETNFRDLAAQRTFYKMHALSTSAVGVTEGRLDVQAGDVIRVNTSSKNVSSDKKDNPQISGRFLITSVQNNVSDGILKTILTMFKYDWSDAGKDDNKRTSSSSIRGGSY